MPRLLSISYPVDKVLVVTLVLAGGTAWCERIFPAQVSKISKDTLIFKEPSKESAQMGDVAAGTPVLLRGYSPKHTWVLVEDEDGAQGWVPTARVDPILPEPVEEDTGKPLPEKGVLPEKAKEPPASAKPGEMAPPLVPTPSEPLFQPNETYDLSFLGREEFRTNSQFVLGAQISVSFYRAVGEGSDRFSRNEVSVGYLRSPTSGKTQWNLPIRLGFSNTRISSHFLLGPDIGFTWSKRQDSGTEKYFGVGYSAGYKLTQFNQIKFRLSYDLGTHSHMGLEGGAQWMFY